MNQQSEHRTLTGKTAIITGASRGIGAAIALRLAQLGANVTIDYLSNDERAQHTKQHIENEADAQGRVITCKADVTDETQVNELAQSYRSKHASAASTSSSTTRSATTRSTHATATPSATPAGTSTRPNSKDVSKAPTTPARPRCPTCDANHWGRIAQHLQQPGRTARPSPIAAPTSQPKEHSSDSRARWRRRPGAWGVTVNAIAAGLTVGTDSSRATTEDVRERIIAQTPLGRLATADDIAGGVAMLVGEDARFVTGQTLHVDGGLTMR